MSITAPLGFRAAGAVAGIKPSGKPDLALIVRDTPDGPGAGAAAVFTRSAMVGAPIEVGRRLRSAWLGGGPPARAMLINAGNSNAATGAQGLRDAEACMAAVAAALRCPPDAVLPSSTGVIGRLLPAGKIVAAVPALAGALARGDAADAAAARAIMTTDLVPKSAFREFLVQGRSIRLGAIGKGSGMIAPRLESAVAPPAPSATMLAFVTTDAPIASLDLQAALDACAAASFNRITVDNHASCSDTVAALASGAAGGPPILRATPAFHAFAAALREVCVDLAEQIVRDGEGATRTFRAVVKGAPTEAAAEAIAREIVNSPLVKCAIHGRDPNWGRIVTAAGNAGVPFNPAGATLRIGPVVVYQAGVPVTEALSDPRLAQAMGGPHVDCELTLSEGPAEWWMMGCDLSAAYVSINADYTT